MDDKRHGATDTLLKNKHPDACQSGEEGTDLLKLKSLTIFGFQEGKSAAEIASSMKIMAVAGRIRERPGFFCSFDGCEAGL